VPPREAKAVGLHDDGRMIYEMERRDLVATKKNKVQVIGPDGEPLFRRDGQGEPYPVMRTEPVSYTSRFVLERSPSGAVFMNENFEATESDRELDRAKAMESAFSEILAKTAIERGLSAEDLIARLIDPIKEAGPVRCWSKRITPSTEAGRRGFFLTATRSTGQGEGQRKPNPMFPARALMRRRLRSRL